MTLKAAIFDWDGTITDSNDVKTQAFLDIFAECGFPAAQYICSYQKTHGGISRFEKYRHYFQTFFNRQPTQAELRQFGINYAALCRQKLLQTPFIPGAVETLTLLSEAEISSFIITGSPAEEIYFLAKERGILPLLKGILGSPQNKQQHLTQILSQNGFAPNEVVFLGDALTDYNAAQACKVPFIGICPSQDASPFPKRTKIMTQIKLNIEKKTIATRA